MRARTIPWAILRTQYRLGRVPIRLLEEQLVARMGPEAPVRLLFERAIGALDAAVGMVLGDGALEDEGVARIERAAELEEAAHIDEIAARRLRQADAELRRRRDEAPNAPGGAARTGRS
ncbi:hypothetical protein [Mycolicibacterium sp. S3B2]|uniref:hypothetical protein n=1 Tax=Mycolicibacterium sp. S3B2 TaxID=3415120 RepID=UPI003C7C0B2B